MDLAALRHQYESMNDDALLEIDRTELVPEAIEVLDQELVQRGLRVPVEPSEPLSEEEVEELTAELAADEEPDWIEEGIVVYGETIGRGNQPRMREAIAILINASIPCHTKVTREADPKAGGRNHCELIVPFNQQLQAISRLDKELFNAQMEADWKAHFNTMSDDELLGLDEDALVAGLRDRADRLVRAWEDELLKRGLAELESE